MAVIELDKRFEWCPHCGNWIRKDRVGPCANRPKGAA
jgi:hypothetical protein